MYNQSKWSKNSIVQTEKNKPKIKKKEEPSSLFQRHRVDTLLVDLRSKFPPTFYQVFVFFLVLYWVILCLCDRVCVWVCFFFTISAQARREADSRYEHEAAVKSGAAIYSWNLKVQPWLTGMFLFCSGGEKRARSSTRSSKTGGKRTWDQIISPSSTQQTASWEESKATVTFVFHFGDDALIPVHFSLFQHFTGGWEWTGAGRAGRSVVSDSIVWLIHLTYSFIIRQPWAFGAVWLCAGILQSSVITEEADVNTSWFTVIWDHIVPVGLMNSALLFNNKRFPLFVSSPLHFVKKKKY